MRRQRFLSRFLLLFFVFGVAALVVAASDERVVARLIGIDAGRPMYVIDVFVGTPPWCASLAVDFIGNGMVLLPTSFKPSSTFDGSSEILCAGKTCVRIPTTYSLGTVDTPVWVDGFVGLGARSPLWAFWPRVHVDKKEIRFLARGDAFPHPAAVAICGETSFCDASSTSGAAVRLFNLDGHVYLPDEETKDVLFGSVYAVELPSKELCFANGCISLEHADMARTVGGVVTLLVKPVNETSFSAFSRTPTISDVASISVSVLSRYSVLRDFEGDRLWFYPEDTLPTHRSNFSLVIMFILAVLYVRSVTAYKKNGTVVRPSARDAIADAVTLSTLVATALESEKYAHGRAALYSTPWLMLCYALGVRYGTGFSAFAAPFAREICIATAAWVVASETGPSHRFILSSILVSFMIYKIAEEITRFLVMGSQLCDVAVMAVQAVSMVILLDASIRADLGPLLDSWHTTMEPLKKKALVCWISVISSVAASLICYDATRLAKSTK